MPSKPGDRAEPPSFPDQSTNPGKKRAVTKQYIPRYRSGAWAIMRALEDFPPGATVTKAEIIRLAQPFCDSSFDTPLDTKHYTAWSSMKLLLEKDYVYKNGNPPRFCLTEEGAEVAKGLRLASAGLARSQEAGPSQKRQRPDENIPSFQAPEELDIWPRLVPQISNPPRQPLMSVTNSAGQGPRILCAGSYSIQFIMDNREIHREEDKTRLETRIGQGGVDYCVRSLDVGDALWVAKCGGEEYVLDYIVERKRMDDLVGSIHDGRFHEQKV
jgi:crossover junction endonuclease MUS81